MTLSELEILNHIQKTQNITKEELKVLLYTNDSIVTEELQ